MPSMISSQAIGKVVITTLIAACLASVASAQTRSQVTGSQLTKRTHTAFVRADVGLQTYESQLVDSNATATAMNYTAGGYAGEERFMGVFVNSNRSRTNFDLNSSSIDTALNELHTEFRMGFLYASLIGSLTDIRMTKADATSTRLLGSGYGGGLSIHVPLTTNMTINAGVKTIATPHTETLASDVKGSIGPRTEGEASMAFDVFGDLVDILVGYRYRTFELTLNDVASKEKQSAPFAGMELGIYF